MTERAKFKIPDEVKQKFTGTKCSKCGGPQFNFNGRIKCGGCEIEMLKQRAEENRKPSILDDYYAQKKVSKSGTNVSKKEPSTLEQSQGDVLKKLFGGTK